MQTGFLSTYKTIVKAPVEKVWHALTDPAIVKQYFFGSNQITDWNPGNPIVFTGEFEGKMYEDKGVVQEFVPHQRLAFSYLSSWNDLPDLPENYLLVTYSVEPVADGTELTITQTNYDAQHQRHSEDNWKTVIDGLKQIVE